MDRQNREISIKAKLVILGIAMLMVTPGGAMQISAPSAMPALVDEPTTNQRVERKIRDCSLGIPCTRRVVSHQIKHKKAIALAAMMGLGMKIRAN